MKYRVIFSLVVIAVVAGLYVLSGQPSGSNYSQPSSSSSPVHDNELKSLKID